MIRPRALFAFIDPDPERLSEFTEFARGSLADRADVVIGVASEREMPVVSGVEIFPVRTSAAEMLNQLAAGCGTQVLIINEGAVLPHLEDQSWELVQALSPGTFLTLDGRRPISIPDALDPAFQELEWDLVEFSRSVHEESPLSFVVSTSDFLKIRGFDERTTFQSCRTMDLLARLRRSGIVRSQIDTLSSFAIDLRSAFPGVAEEKFPQMVSMRENQKAQVQSDHSIYRNLESWSVPKTYRPVLVSVAIATRDRAEYIADSINSVLAQTFEDFELIVVDDGSEDGTEAVVRSFEDPRVIYIGQEPKGISAARNAAADRSIGHFTAVHDDDDIMLPWRLEVSLQTITANDHASYGSWVNFDNETADMALHITKRSFGRDLVAHSGQTPGHATWLLPTSVVQTIRYDETLTSSVDHNLAVRTAMSGIRWKHSEKVLFLRRMHPTQVSQTDARRQRAAAVLSRYANGFSADFNSMKVMGDKGKALTFPAPAEKDKLFQTFAAYLPDHLVEREVLIQGLVGKKILTLDLHDRFEFIAAETDLRTGRSTLELGGVSGVTLADMVSLRRNGVVGCRFKARLRTERNEPHDAMTVQTFETIVRDRQARELQAVTLKNPAGVVLRVDADHLLPEVLDSATALITSKHFSINYGDYQRIRFILLAFKNLESVNRFTAKSPDLRGRWQVLVPSKRDFTTVANSHLGLM